MAAMFGILKKKQPSLNCYIVSAKPVILLTYWHDFAINFMQMLLKHYQKRKTHISYF